MTEGDFSRPSRQFARPIFIDRLDETGIARALDPVGSGRGERRHDEALLQKLIFQFPQVLPIQEIEPGFGRVVPICLELPTPAGVADNLFVTESGNLIVAECKLWRNPEARREVVAQIIDYAHAMAAWDYDDLEKAVHKGVMPDGAEPPSSLYDYIGEADIDEADFADAVSRNLRLGRLLLLIVGDGVREGVESLLGYLQKHAGFHFTLGVVEMPVFKGPVDGFYIQPRILARTVNIERGIVKIADGRTVVEAPETRHDDGASGRRTSISQDRLLEMLEEVDPNLPVALQKFVDRAQDQGIELKPATKSLQLRWRGPGDQDFALGGINEKGELVTYNINWVPDSMGRIDLAQEYLEKIAEIIGGEVRKTPNPAAWYVVESGTTRQPQAMVLLSRQKEWLAAIEEYAEKLTAACDAASTE